MPPDGVPETPMAVTLTDDADAPALAPEPQRRRVRRKTAKAATEAETPLDAADESAAPPLAAEIAFVETRPGPEPEVAAQPEPAAPEPVEPEPVAPEPIALVEAPVTPTPEADLSEIIANDPAQITAPPVKPKRGWWRL